MRKQYCRFSSIFFVGMLVCGSLAQAKDKTKVPPSPPKDEIQVVGHIPLIGGPVTRFQSTQHYSSYYLYAEHDAGKSVTLIDVTKVARPVVLTDVSNAPGGGSESLLVVAGTAALVNSYPGAPSVTASAPQTLKIMDFSDPAHPQVAREFAGVTAIGRSESRGLIFVANGEGIWILQQHLAEDPEMVKAYDDYIRYYR
jgi:hypothetical protein